VILNWQSGTHLKVFPLKLPSLDVHFTFAKQ